MKTISFLLLIYSINTYANDREAQGCTIPFFKKESPCVTKEKNKITKPPKVIETTPKNMEVKLHELLNDVTDYKNENNMKTNKLMEELIVMKKEFNQYKVKKSEEFKKIKKELNRTNKQLKQNKKKLVVLQKKVKTAKAKKNIVKYVVKKEIPIAPQIVDEMSPPSIPIYEKKERVTVRKIIHKMSPSVIPIYNTPWIEIVVENDMTIYELALKYYGNKESYKKIYLANKNIIGNDFKIYNGMSLIIPITENFKEQPIILNTY